MQARIQQDANKNETRRKQETETQITKESG